MTRNYTEDYNHDGGGRRERPRHRPRHGWGKRILLLCACVAVLAVIFSFYRDDLRGLFGAGAPTAEPPPTSESGITADSIGTVEAGTKQEEETAWSLILVNRWNVIPDDYAVDLTKLSNGASVDVRIYPALQEMFDAARDEGVYPIVASGYRTSEKQQRLMDEKIADYEAGGYSAADAKTAAEAWVAIPGTSEHQLGIAVDINADGIHSTGEEVYAWLEKNAYQYGFIRRYPPDKTEITGVINEPWHYRYVGVDTATDMYGQGVCLEEYLNQTK